MAKMELNVGNIVEIVFNEPNDVTEGKVVAEVEGHYIVKCGERLCTFTLEGKDTTDSSVYIRKITAPSEISLNSDMQVYNEKYGRGIITDHDPTDDTFLIKFIDHDNFTAWYHKNGTRICSSDPMRVKPLPKCIEFVPGDLVEVWDYNEDTPVTTIFTTYVKNSPHPYATINGVWMNCRKTSKLEYIKKMLEK